MRANNQNQQPQSTENTEGSESKIKTEPKKLKRFFLCFQCIPWTTKNLIRGLDSNIRSYPVDPVKRKGFLN